MEGTIHQRRWHWAYEFWPCLSRLLKKRRGFFLLFFLVFFLARRAFMIPFLQSFIFSLTTPWWWNKFPFNENIWLLFQLFSFFACTNSTVYFLSKSLLFLTYSFGGDTPYILSSPLFYIIQSVSIHDVYTHFYFPPGRVPFFSGSFWGHELAWMEAVGGVFLHISPPRPPPPPYTH